ncbi:phosphate signaling complex protein PhoU [Solicola sp. PLA-1-18]|uniref:phosphate signaling complex protein PhoU n=1 Tax=Solicola sp. PLA-1-18 TaxID=3380532 RepID=UPI003B80F93F
MRDLYYDQLTEVIDDLVAMTSAVQTAVAQGTRALLEGDVEVAESVIAGQPDVAASRDLIETRSLELMATQAPVATDLRQLVAALRMVAHLERVGALSAHIAKIARLRTPELAVPEGLRPTVARMAEVADALIGNAAAVVSSRDTDAALAMVAEDEELDDLRRSLLRSVLGKDWTHGVEPAIDLALLGRYYERIGDHAVSVARLVVFLATGELPGRADDTGDVLLGGTVADV